MLLATSGSSFFKVEKDIDSILKHWCQKRTKQLYLKLQM